MKIIPPWRVIRILRSRKCSFSLAHSTYSRKRRRRNPFREAEKIGATNEQGSQRGSNYKRKGSRKATNHRKYHI
jgi:hypothetical protein